MAFCMNCGAELEDGVRFCTHCGTPVGETGEAAGDGLDVLDETMIVEEHATVAGSAAPQTQPQSAPAQPAYAVPQSPEDTSTKIPPTVPSYQEQAQAPAPKRAASTGKVVGIVLGVVAAVAVVGFALFYFLNPLGLTTGIFENSAAAQAAAAEAAQAELEAAQAEKEELQKQLDEANKDDSGSTVIVVPGGSSDGSSDGSGSVVTDDDGLTITAPAGYPSVSVGNSGEVLPASAYRTITLDDIDGMNDWELCVARNEIYARHGYAFRRDDLAEFFSKLSWYTIDPDFDESEMSKLEIDNANTILALEKERGSQYLD